MTAVAAIVEGDGEVIALPILLRRLGLWLTPNRKLPQILTPIRVPRDRFLNKPAEFSRHLQLAAAKCGPTGWVLILLDADDDCPAELAEDIQKRAIKLIPHRRIAVVLANREFEAWFIASSLSLNGCRGFALGNQVIPPAEAPRDAKGWIKERMPRRAYGATTDQPAFTARIDLEMAHKNSRSFRKLAAEWVRQVAPNESPTGS